MKPYLAAALLLAASALAGPAMSDAGMAETEPKPAEPTAATPASVLRFVVYYPHFPPYIYTEPPQNQVIGIIPDLLAPLFEQLQIQTEYVLDNRSGAEQRLYKGDVDAMMLNPAWARHPDKLLFSDGIIPYNDYLFASSKQQLPLQKAQLQGTKICTREYYVYPQLEPLFNSDTLLRIDSSSQEAQLRMVFNNRCDLVYMNDLIARWLVQHNFSDRSLYRSGLYVGKASLTIALHPRWQALLPKLNRFIEQQQQSGETQRIISRYVTADNR